MPVLFLCDTPGMMVGPEVEKTALVRHCSRLFVTGANLTRAVRHHRAAQGLWAGRPGDGRRLVPCARTFAIAWPTGEFGGMGLEGAVKLGYRKELEAIADPAERRAAVRQDGGRRLCARQGAQHRDLLRGRRGHRPRRIRGAGSRPPCWARSRGRATSTRGDRTSTRGDRICNEGDARSVPARR